MLLKECAAAGLTLFEIASIVSRPIVGMDEEPSELEKICMLARQNADYSMDVETIPESDSEDADSLSVDGDALGDLGQSTVVTRGVIMGHEVSLTSSHLSASYDCAEVEDFGMQLFALSVLSGIETLSLSLLLHGAPLKVLLVL